MHVKTPSTGASVEELAVEVGTSHQVVLHGVSLTVAPGEIVGLAGETGSGKTTLGLSLLGYTAPGLAVESGRVTVGDDVLTGAGAVDAAHLRSARGNLVSYVPQDPSSALSPGIRIGQTIREILRAHSVTDPREQAARRVELFSAVGLPVDDGFARRYPHELSGGQQQRVAIAIAFALHPRLVVMDEPTTGLDVTTKGKVVQLVTRLSRDTGASVVFISHDLRLLLSFADRVVVLFDGRIVEEAPATELVASARHPYTRRLLDALPQTDGAARMTPIAPGATPVLTVRGMYAHYGRSPVTHGVDLDLYPGACLAVVGESGSGKTTTARAIAGLHTGYEGTVALGGDVLARDVVARSIQQKKAIQYVFQNPYASLNPRRTIGGSIAICARVLRGMNRTDARAEAGRLIQQVGLRPDHLLALPHQLSGGQRQRAALARALAAEPSVLVCDEITSSLDISVQQEIIDLLQELQQVSGLSMLFITHDLGLARSVAESTAVMLGGAIVEQGPTSHVLDSPQHEYTAALVQAASLRPARVPLRDGR